jgi:hypothetical protein
MAHNHHVFKMAVGGWWPCEERVLVSLLAENYPLRKIAHILGRDRTAVYAKIAVMQRQQQKRMEQAA